jgi:hypothetical protein
MDKNGDTIANGWTDGRSQRRRELLNRSNPAQECIGRTRSLVPFHRDSESPRGVRRRSNSSPFRHGDTRERAGNRSILFVDHDASDNGVVARLTEGTRCTTTSEVILAGGERRQEPCKYEASCAKHGYP